MAEVIELPIHQDATIYTNMDWQSLQFTFYEDLEETTATDFSLSTFSGEVLDEIGGSKLFDLSFNTPADDGIIWPQLTDTQTATISGKTCYYFVYVTTGGIKTPYLKGDLTVSIEFEPGA